MCNMNDFEWRKNEKIAKNHYNNLETVEFSAYKFFSANFVTIVVKHNNNELEYAKSAESDGLNLRKLTKTKNNLETVEFSAYIFFSASFVVIAVQDNWNELNNAKSAESDDLNLRKLTKTSFLGQFGHLVYFGAKTLFFFKNPKSSLF